MLRAEGKRFCVNDYRLIETLLYEWSLYDQRIYPGQSWLIDQLLRDYRLPEDVLGENGLLKQLAKALLERAMHAELTHHPNYDNYS